MPSKNTRLEIRFDPGLIDALHSRQQEMAKEGVNVTLSELIRQSVRQHLGVKVARPPHRGGTRKDK